MLICFQACSRPTARQSEAFNPVQNQQTNRKGLGVSLLSGFNEREEVKSLQHFASKVPAGGDLSSHGPESLGVLLAQWNHCMNRAIVKVLCKSSSLARAMRSREKHVERRHT